MNRKLTYGMLQRAVCRALQVEYPSIKSGALANKVNDARMIIAYLSIVNDVLLYYSSEITVRYEYLAAELRLNYGFKNDLLGYVESKLKSEKLFEAKFNLCVQIINKENKAKINMSRTAHELMQVRTELMHQASKLKRLLTNSTINDSLKTKLSTRLSSTTNSFKR